jgi:hypothetical protein
MASGSPPCPPLDEIRVRDRDRVRGRLFRGGFA